MWYVASRGLLILVAALGLFAVFHASWRPVFAVALSLLLVAHTCYSLLVNDRLLSPHVPQLLLQITRYFEHFIFWLCFLFEIVFNYCRRFLCFGLSHWKELVSPKMNRRMSSGYRLSVEPDTERGSSLHNSENQDLGLGVTSTPLPAWKSTKNGSLRVSTPKLKKTISDNKETGRYNTFEGSPPWGDSNSPKMRSRASGVKTVQTVAGPLLASTRYNIDPKVYSDVSSPGLTTRLTKYATEANTKLTHQSRYGTGQFPKVNLHASPMPLLNAKSIKAPVTVRVAPPESIRLSPPERKKVLTNSCLIEKVSPNVVQVLKDISLKRHASRDDITTDLAKKQRTERIYHDELGNLEEMTQKRARDDSPKSEDEVGEEYQNFRPKKRTKTPSCNDIINSLSSSIHVLSGVKRKADTSYNEAREFEKHFKPLNKSNSPVPKVVQKSSEPAPLRNNGDLLTQKMTLKNKIPEKKVDLKQKTNSGKNSEIKLADKLFMRPEPESNERLRALIEEQGNVRATFNTDDKDEIKKEDIINMRQNSMRARLQSMFDAISGKTATKINPDVVIQAEEIAKEPETTSAFNHSTLISTTSTINVNTSPIATSTPASILVKEHTEKSTPAKHVTFNFDSTANVPKTVAKTVSVSETSNSDTLNSNSFMNTPNTTLDSTKTQMTCKQVNPPSKTTAAPPPSNFLTTTTISSTSTFVASSENTSKFTFGTKTVTQNSPKTTEINSVVANTTPIAATIKVNNVSTPNSVGLPQAVISSINTSTPAATSLFTFGSNTAVTIATTKPESQFSFGSSFATPAKPETSFGNSKTPNFNLSAATSSGTTSLGTATTTSVTTSAVNFGNTGAVQTMSRDVSNFGNFFVPKTTNIFPGFGHTKAAMTTSNQIPHLGNAVTTSNSTIPNFGNAVTTSTNTIASFGNITSASVVSNFGNVTTASNAIPTFGNTSGSNNTTTTLFGNSTVSTTPTTSTTTMFGTTTPMFANTGSSFGSDNKTTVPANSSALSNIFGSSSTAAVISASNAFGNTTGVSSPAGNTLFNATSTTSPNVFGTSAITTTSSLFATTTTACIFGSTTATPSTTTTSLFGSTTASSIFGSTTVTPATTAPTLFGSTTASNLFVSTTATPATTTSTLFGSTVGMPATTASNLFSSTTTTPVTTMSNLFGTTASKQVTVSSNLFGTTATTTTTVASSLFGSNAPAAVTTASSLFGSTTTTSSTMASNLFGSPITTVSNLFGSTTSVPVTTSSSLFGAGTATPITTTSNVFGVSSATSVTTTASSIFSSDSAFKQPPVFGSTFAASTTATTTTTSFGTSGGITFGGASNGFSSSAATTTTTASPFGAPQNQSFGSNSFGNTSTNSNTNSFSFGGFAFGGPTNTPVTTSGSAVFQFGSGVSKSGGFNFNAPTGTPNINFSTGTPGTPSFGAPVQGNMFSIGTGSTAPRTRTHRDRARRQR